jgi:RNA polymerase sigma factor (sigma-70 family)
MCIPPPDPAEAWKTAAPLFPVVRREAERASRKSRESADDLFQSGCLWLVGRLKAGTMPADALAVLRKIRNYYRRHTCRRGPTLEQLPDEYDGPAPDEDEASFFGPESFSRLEAGLAKLPGRQSVAVRLRYGLDGAGERGPAQVAAEMGCTKQAVQFLLRKALHHLRKEFPDLI